MVTRRGFLGTMLGVMAAPAIVRASSLMKIVVPKKEIILPPSFNRGAATERGGELTKWMPAGRGLTSPIWTTDEIVVASSLSLASPYMSDAAVAAVLQRMSNLGKGTLL